MGLAELHLVAHQHDAARGRARGHEIGQRHLPGLVHEQQVDQPLVVLPANSQAVPAISWKSAGTALSKMSVIMVPATWFSGLSGSDFL
ncbi:hypothetical protein CTJ15_03670 (plasmid) [Roseomonas sp. FDAARGOS_362]|uniref:hypothetical protein n=1 Tax=Roseomonas sp. FDAARGOS_362 TaxID=2018065 RepID=UPI000C1994BD|nr:hypothetical protein [Roseomonas sp. FDAARGOS_362]ATR19470.1 hypothetical protein CTJ15_03670 [Roseomonas sp. FDAARGOS_362]